MTATVRPCSLRVSVCAAVSIPFAKPLTTVHPELHNMRAIWRVAEIAWGLALREPTMHIPWSISLRLPRVNMMGGGSRGHRVIVVGSHCQAMREDFLR